MSSQENGGAVAGSSAGSSQRDERARKERSIRELAVKFIGLFMQASKTPTGSISLEQACAHAPHASPAPAFLTAIRHPSRPPSSRRRARCCCTSAAASSRTWER